MQPNSRVMLCLLLSRNGISGIGVTDGRHRWYERIDNYVSNTTAELFAICAALQLAAHLRPPAQKILVATDCRPILQTLRELHLGFLRLLFIYRIAGWIVENVMN